MAEHTYRPDGKRTQPAMPTNLTSNRFSWRHPSTLLEDRWRVEYFSASLRYWRHLTFVVLSRCHHAALLGKPRPHLGIYCTSCTFSQGRVYDWACHISFPAICSLQNSATKYTQVQCPQHAVRCWCLRGGFGRLLDKTADKKSFSKRGRTGLLAPWMHRCHYYARYGVPRAEWRQSEHIRRG